MIPLVFFAFVCKIAMQTVVAIYYLCEPRKYIFHIRQRYEREIGSFPHIKYFPYLLCECFPLYRLLYLSSGGEFPHGGSFFYAQRNTTAATPLATFFPTVRCKKFAKRVVIRRIADIFSGRMSTP